MNKHFFKLPLKLTGDRLLFIVITWVFSVTLSVFLSQILSVSENHIGLIYSALTATVYIALIYYEVYEVGSLEAGRGCASMKSAVFRCLLWQVPSLILFFLYLISLHTPLSTPLFHGLLGSLYLAPFIGPRGASPSEFTNLVQYVTCIFLEAAVFLVSYLFGMKDIVLFKSKKKESRGTMKR